MDEQGELIEFTKEEFDAMPRDQQLYFLKQQLHIRGIKRDRG
jgi:hypothetical protein